MAFNVNDLMDELFSEGDDCEHAGECLWINTKEFTKRTQGMTAKQVGQLLLEMVDLYKQGRMKNGPAVRVDPPEDQEDANGTST